MNTPIAERLRLAERCDTEMVNSVKIALIQAAGPNRTAHRTAAAEWATIAAALRSQATDTPTWLGDK